MVAATMQIFNVNESPSSRRIFIIGGGIVGASLAYFLSQDGTDREIIVIDKCWNELLGSTGHAYWDMSNTSSLQSIIYKYLRSDLFDIFSQYVNEHRFT